MSFLFNRSRGSTNGSPSGSPKGSPKPSRRARGNKAGSKEPPVLTGSATASSPGSSRPGSPLKAGASSSSLVLGPNPSLADVVALTKWTVSPYAKQLVRDGRNAPELDVWQFKIKTGDVHYAGCKSRITMDVYGAKGGMFNIQINPDGQKFDRNTEVTVIVEDPRGMPLGQLRKIRLRSDNTSSNASWFVAAVTAHHLKGDVMPTKLAADSASQVTEHYDFKCDRWLSNEYDDKQLVRELPASGPFCENRPQKMRELRKYRVQVYTGKPTGIGTQAGTDANVYLKLEGEGSDTGVRALLHATTPHRDLFEAGQMDEFEIEAVGIGPLRKLRVGHDNKGGLMHKLHSKGGAGWFLDKVVVIDPTAAAGSNEVTFECERWLHEGKDDGHVERELVPAVPKQMATYSITAWTHRTAMGPLHTPPFPQIELHGELLGETSKTKRADLAKPDDPPPKGSRVFDSDSVDRFTVEGRYVGELTYATIWYEGVRPTTNAVTHTRQATVFSSGGQKFAKSAGHTAETAAQSLGAHRKAAAAAEEDSGTVYNWKLRKLEIKVEAVVDGEQVNETFWCDWSAPVGEGHSSNRRVPLHKREAKAPKKKTEARGRLTSTGLWVHEVTAGLGKRPPMHKKTDCWNKTYAEELLSRTHRERMRSGGGKVGKPGGDNDDFMADQENKKETAEEKKKRSDLAVRGIEKRFKEIQAEKKVKAKADKADKEAKAALAKTKREYGKTATSEWLATKTASIRRAKAAETGMQLDAERIRRTRDRMNRQAFAEWKRGKAQIGSIRRETATSKQRFEIRDARRINKTLKTAARFCPLPGSTGGSAGGYYSTVPAGSNGWQPTGVGEASKTRWLYGGRQAAGMDGADHYEH